MRCAKCASIISGRWWCITLEAATGEYTASFHHACLQGVMSATAVRLLEQSVIDAGWRQAPLPGMESTTP